MTDATTTGPAVDAVAEDRLAAIKGQLAAVPSGRWFWRGNVDHPDGIHLAAPGYTDSEGRRRFGPNVLSLVRHEVDERDARLAGCYERDLIPESNIYEDERSTRPYGIRVGRDRFVHFEPEDTFDARRDAAYAAESEEIAKQWRHDAHGEPRYDNRLAFTDEHDMLVEATTLAVYEVAPQATDPDDPKVYRRDIVGFRHPVADFLTTARADMDFLVAEVERLRAVRDASTDGGTTAGAVRMNSYVARYTAPEQYAGLEKTFTTLAEAQEFADAENEGGELSGIAVEVGIRPIYKGDFEPLPVRGQ